MNGGDFGSFLSGITSDPEMMSKIKAISDSLTGGESPLPNNGTMLPISTEGHDEKSTAPIYGSRTAANRAVLIKALMPYLSDGRREKAELLLKIISLAELGQRMI